LSPSNIEKLALGGGRGKSLREEMNDTEKSRQLAVLKNWKNGVVVKTRSHEIEI
jgi:hypothetical protein